MATPRFDSTFHPWVTGQLTATRTRILGSDAWQTSTQYYDSRGRVIQTVEDNRLGGLSRSDLLYDFIGNLTHQRESHGKADGSADVLENVNSYDEQGRLLEQSITLNGGTAATLTYTYDALGRLTVKRYGSVEEQLTYHVRGWLTGKESTPFRMRLRYERPEGGSAARWNGSLSEWEWQQGTSPAMQYGFSYDGLNRFTGAVQKQKSGNAWPALSGDYVKKGLTYDRNGNLKKDSRRALLFDYNSLNLLSEVRRGGQLAAKYDWLADGTKLGVRDGSGTDGFVYAGSLTYRRRGGVLKLETAHFGDGVIRVNENGTQEVEYFLTDHLGSVRVIVDAVGAVKERNDYYPFGARHVRSDYALSTNRWKYNGKELQTTGDLGFLDYGARMYDMSVGRWFGMDPLAEEYTALCGYVFSGNNPLILVDRNGGFFTHYVDKDYNVLFQTDDGNDDVVMVPDAYVGDFRKYSDFSSGLDYIFNSLGWNRYWKDKFGLADRQFNEWELMFLDGFNTGWSRDNAAEYLLKSTAGNLISMSFSEALSQWTNPELVVGNLSAGAIGWSNVLSIRNSLLKPFTKSNLKLGQAMHKKYKIDLHDDEYYIKEYRLPSGRRIDFLDIPNATIYELKPNNPRAIKMGMKQLERYKKELETMERFKNVNWKIQLDVY